MKIIINSQKMEFEDGVTIDDILEYLKIKEKAMAVAVNMQIIKKDDWGSFSPKESDKIEVLQFVGGG
jgi:sulfur carrier protein